MKTDLIMEKECHDYEAKKKIGINACIRALGRRFYNRHENSVYSCEPTERGLYCFVGVNTFPAKGNSLILSSSYQWEYFASCYVVGEENYRVEMDECRLPHGRKVWWT